MATPPATEHAAASTPTRRFQLRTDPTIFGISVGFAVLFILFTAMAPDLAGDIFATASAWLLRSFNWFFIGAVSSFIIYLVAIFVSRYGRLKLGDDDDEPEHSTMAWFGMLFAGGMGAMLMFWGIAEPITHFANPPMANVAPGSEDAAIQAIAFTLYHYGIHLWAIFALPGLAFGYFIYKRKLPPRVSSIFAPVLGRHIYGLPGKIIDSIAVIGTVFGVAVSVGLGTLQIARGLNIRFGISESAGVLFGIIAIIALTAIYSVLRGVNRGVKVLSNINMIAAVFLLGFILVTGPTLLLMRGTVESAGIYADTLPHLSFWTDQFMDNPGWQGAWTVFYWAWTICWSPFIGIFVARISRGRTIRQFIAGVLILPALFDIVWFSVFGRAALFFERSEPGSLTGPVAEEGDIPGALFLFLEHFPFYPVISVLALFIIVIFFITSVDSAAITTDMMVTGEQDAAPVRYRVLWALIIAGVTAALIFASGGRGLDVLQNVIVIIGVPCFIMAIVMMYSLTKAMSEDAGAQARMESRKWEKAHTAEAYEEQDSRPAPGYDEDGNELPTLELTTDEDGTVVISSDVRFEGEVSVEDSSATPTALDGERVTATQPDSTT